MDSPEPFGLDFIRDELAKARRTSLWHGKRTPFFAETDISRLTCRSNIEKVVLEDETIEFSQKVGFVNYIYENTRRLFLMFIHADLPIRLLEVIGYIDNDLPLPVASLSTFLNLKFHDRRNRLSLETLITTTQWSFNVPKISWAGVHTRFHPDSIPPITSMVQIGCGSYGGVYKIEIDPTYVAEAIQQPFALKIIPPYYSGRTSGNQSSLRERDLLNALRRFGHAHIIRLLGSFEYLDQLCMVFPLATCDLNRYMDQESQKNDPKYVSWIIRQLQGLTDALSKIHGTGVQETGTVRHETGYHRDLKPENILFFQDSVESRIYGTLQISDFGLAKLHSNTTSTEKGHPRSNTTALGTPRYSPPELFLGGRTDPSASHDLWSFGCIILELLIWTQFGKEGRELFLRRVDQLYYPTEQTDFEIHDQVREWIERLECSDLHPGLSKLLGVTVNKLLVWDPDGRWTSAELLNFFSTLETEHKHLLLPTSVHP